MGSHFASLFFWYCRTVNVSEIMDGKIVSTRLVMVRLVETDANVPFILEKVKVAMGGGEDYALTDNHGNEIVDCEGSTGK